MYQIMAEQESIFCNPAGREGAMASKIQPFIQRQHMIQPTYEIYHYRDTYPNEVALHHHDFYEMYLFLSGSVDYVIDSRHYRISPGDVLLISPNELHQPMFSGERQPYERIVLWINKSFLDQFTVVGTALNRCFEQAEKHHANLLRADSADLDLMVKLLDYARNEMESREFASSLLADTLMIQTLVILNRLSERSSETAEIVDKSGGVVARVLAYINEHYHEDLSLDQLANRFYISKYHLSREFNRLVGTSVYRYIVQKRLVMAKQMLGQGVPSSEVYQHCGFGDYSNFYRAFKAEYQVSPREYVANLKTTAALVEAGVRERSRLKWSGTE